jgi:hypothetical protein
MRVSWRYVGSKMDAVDEEKNAYFRMESLGPEPETKEFQLVSPGLSFRGSLVVSAPPRRARIYLAYFLMHFRRWPEVYPNQASRRSFFVYVLGALVEVQRNCVDFTGMTFYTDRPAYGDNSPYLNFEPPTDQEIAEYQKTARVPL